MRLDPALPFARAAARRDFTVNAILRDALTGEIVDPFGGQADLRRGVLRAVPGDGFAEDPLRVLRGAQFAARFRLSPDAKTLEKMRMMKTDALSPARVLGEMKKAMASDAPDVFFDVLRRADALRPWFGELAALIGVPQPPRYHPEGDAYTHSMRALHAAAQKKARALRPEAFVFAALTHDLGKAVSTARGEDGEWHACGHENTGVPLTRAMLGRLGVNREIIAYCENMCRLHMRAHVCHYRQAETGETNLLFDESVCPNDLALLAVCDTLGKGSASGGAADEEAFLTGRVRVYEETAARGLPDEEAFLTGRVRHDARGGHGAGTSTGRGARGGAAARADGRNRRRSRSECFEEKKMTDINGIFSFCEAVGTAAFAVSGAMVAVDRGTDIFGVLLMAVFTALGGGTLRDVLIGYFPPRMFTNFHYVLLACLCALVVFVIARVYKERYVAREKMIEQINNVFDAVGLGVFAVSGARIGMEAGFADNMFLTTFLGATTAIGGGMLRDVLLREMPFVLKKRVYAVAAILGALGYALLLRAGVGEIMAYGLGMIITTAVRILATVFKWNLPKAI